MTTPLLLRYARRMACSALGGTPPVGALGVDKAGAGKGGEGRELGRGGEGLGALDAVGRGEEGDTVRGGDAGDAARR